jgi:divalent metal cation (Fe/Co/Zn/Cd) transporter
MKKNRAKQKLKITKSYNSSALFADAVSTTYFEENGLVTEFPPKKLKMQQTGQIMYGCNPLLDQSEAWIIYCYFLKTWFSMFYQMSRIIGFALFSY